MESQAEILQNFVSKVKDSERRFEEGQDDYAMEFLKIRVDSDDLRDLDEFKSVVGARAENFRKNRYRDILPFDYSRVTIDSKPSRNDSGDYINASFINGANDKVAYVATQGPLKETLADFWQMIYQYEVNVVVMLCDLIESGKPKCEQYWPESGSKLRYGELRITFVSEVKEREHFVLRTLRLKRKGSGEKERSIFQFQYFGWPDHGTPDEIAPLLEFMKIIRDYQPEDQFSPIVVHCSAGCGRTGTVCALDYVRSLIKSKRVPPDFSISNLVSDLRKQRPAMVQSKEQYILLHRAIALLFEKELETRRSNQLHINVSDVFVSSPPLTPAPPENSCVPKQGAIRSASLSPAASSGTSYTCVSGSGSDDSSSAVNVVLNENSTVVNGAEGKGAVRCIPPSTTTVEIGICSSNGCDMVLPAERSTNNKVEEERSVGMNNVVANGGDADRNKATDNSLSAHADSSARSPVAEAHSSAEASILSNSSNSSHELKKTGTDATTFGFPEKLTTTNLVGPKAPPSSWPDHEEIVNRIQRL